jgi:Family of unknown function (DUF5681)
MRRSAYGTCANPRGRGKRKIPTEAEIIRNVLNFPVEFTERGKSKRAPRVEIMIKRFGAAALKGDPGAAALLLEMRARLEKLIVLDGPLSAREYLTVRECHPSGRA